MEQFILEARRQAVAQEQIGAQGAAEQPFEEEVKQSVPGFLGPSKDAGGARFKRALGLRCQMGRFGPRRAGCGQPVQLVACPPEDHGPRG